jgi:hypothetical protein
MQQVDKKENLLKLVVKDIEILLYISAILVEKWTLLHFF